MKIRHILLCAIAVLMAFAVPLELSAQDQDQDPPPTTTEEIITVTATRLPMSLGEITGTANVVPGNELRERPALGLDEALKWMPQVSLFRRSPARAAHPTSQGLNLRGVAPSGTSRALVLFDGIPLTDAFGGWVYWDRIPMSAIERAEIALGGSSAPFGNQALSGALQLVGRTAPSSGYELEARILGGGQSTFGLDVLAATASGSVGALFAANVFRTDGYFVVAADDRGTVDTRVASRHAAGLLRFDLPQGFTLTFDGLLEERDNGTPEQTNRTRSYGLAVRWSDSLMAQRGWSASLFARSQVFESRFSSVAADRDSELAVLQQRVPSDDLGASAQHWRALGSGGLSLGADWRRVSGVSEETVLTIDLQRQAGGTQNIGGIFAAAQLRPADSWLLDLSLRGDGWHNAPRDEAVADKSLLTGSPRIGVLWNVAPTWSLRASGYGSFRAPTLNELYRQFRVGNIITRANSELGRERLLGVEGGAAVDRGALRVALTGYHNRLDDAVVNAPVAETPSLVFRQRRNLGAADVSGIELDARHRAGRWDAGLAAAWMRSRIREDPVEPGEPAPPESVVGNRLPQVPGYRLRASLMYRATSWHAMAALLATGLQYEDIANRQPLAAGVTADVAVQLRLSAVASLSINAQNLFDQRLEVARTPALRLGPPRNVSLNATLSISDGR